MSNHSIPQDLNTSPQKNYQSLHHTFDINLAEKYGIKEAIIIHHFQHWISFNKRLKRNSHEGRTWSYQTLDEIAAHFPYLSKSEIFEIITKLCKGKSRRSTQKQSFDPVLRKGNFNKHKYDKTVWYAFENEESFGILANANSLIGKCQNGDRQMPTPIPDTKPDTKPDIKECGENSTKPSSLASPAVASKKRISVKEDPIERAMEVFTTPKQHKALLVRLKDEKRVERCYELLSEWRIDKQKFGGSDYRCILSWVIDKLEQEEKNFSNKTAKKISVTTKSLKPKYSTSIRVKGIWTYKDKEGNQVDENGILIKSKDNL